MGIDCGWTSCAHQYCSIKPLLRGEKNNLKDLWVSHHHGQSILHLTTNQIQVVQWTIILNPKIPFVTQKIFPLKSLISEALPLSLTSSFLEPGIGSIKHRGSFWQLFTEATPVTPFPVTKTSPHKSKITIKSYFELFIYLHLKIK